MSEGVIIQFIRDCVDILRGKIYRDLTGKFAYFCLHRVHRMSRRCM